MVNEIKNWWADFKDLEHDIEETHKPYNLKKQKF